MLTTLQKPKTTPAAGISQMTDDAAGPAAPPPLVASGPSAEAPSASPRTPWDGLPKPKGKPQRQVRTNPDRLAGRRNWSSPDRTRRVRLPVQGQDHSCRPKYLSKLRRNRAIEIIHLNAEGKHDLTSVESCRCRSQQTCRKLSLSSSSTGRVEIAISLQAEVDFIDETVKFMASDANARSQTSAQYSWPVSLPDYLMPSVTH
ncbi:hypothetical protein FPCIR_5485 [Fusarium pseudocircinatum]|uniref:Uncharacterized protein n=1 Tax=Fusarium pseudocircinatum TaxID=56676 RepID=A0A8H5ULS7_9HYPO|nr:hypothetical protein FPCIR_5485 [Fusarium pseudocircinatum]